MVRLRYELVLGFPRRPLRESLVLGALATQQNLEEEEEVLGKEEEEEEEVLGEEGEGGEEVV